MSTEKQLAANRRNAQLSTGPRTEAGKSRSRMNALKSGLYAESLVVCGEDSSALAQLSAEYHAQLHPVTPFERDLVDTIVYNQWLIRRPGSSKPRSGITTTRRKPLTSSLGIPSTSAVAAIRSSVPSATRSLTSPACTPVSAL